MGHFSHTCKLSHLPITGGPAVIFPMVMTDRLYDNSEESIRVLGKAYMCSNEGTRLKFIPCMFPIRGEYDTYGRLENIIEDDNTKIIEEYYGLPIQTIADIICSGRKDDGYDDVLNEIMDPNVKYEYGKPVYQERYKELLKVSGMWVHGEFYDRITSEGSKDDYDKLDLGQDIVLTSLGFKLLDEPSKDDRYTKQYEKDGLVIKSDGTWINVPKEGIYTFKQLRAYCFKKGVNIDITPFTSRDVWEQRFDFLLKNNTFNISNNSEKVSDALKALKDSENNKEMIDEIRKTFGFEDEITDDEIFSELIHIMLNSRLSSSREMQTLTYFMLNTDGYSAYAIKNPLTSLYMNASKEGKLRDNFVRFWRFDRLMYACGVFYDIVGTSPQDGEHKEVSKVLTVANQILNEYIASWDEEDEYEEYEGENEE
jgi:hypothetical protein